MKRILICVLLSLFAFVVNARVELPPIFADFMVLQQKSDVALWGKAEPGSKVTIMPSWSRHKTVITTKADSSWFAYVSTPAAGGPYSITFNDGEKLTLNNVLIGEVWICAGQSNMDMPMKGYRGQPVDGAVDLILGAKASTPIRMCKLERTKSFDPLFRCPTRWYEHTPEGVSNISATAYFFAKRLYETLGVPVGIIHVAWGGSSIEAWMNPDLLRRDFGDEISLEYIDKRYWPRKNHHLVPGALYNGMLHTLVPFTAKGFLWYQGCTNRDRYEQYKRLQPAFAAMLRSEWGNEDMPFYFVQIAPHGYSAPEERVAGYMMWAQAQTLELIPHSGMAATLDAGEEACIHPAGKKVVGDRLAFCALENDYGIKQIDAKTPLPVSFDYGEGEVIVTFEVGDMGLGPINTDLDGFELAGEDRIFYPAKGYVLKGSRRQVKVYKCPQVPRPVAVRYCMRNWSEATLFNNFGIPASPFRSDDWE